MASSPNGNCARKGVGDEAVPAPCPFGSRGIDRVHSRRGVLVLCPRHLFAHSSIHLSNYPLIHSSTDPLIHSSQRGIVPKEACLASEKS